ncbi:MAG TPA: cyclopropane-fatty-acyl-phospholipid synthase family protein [Candidatus Binatia bacterium]|nr:cyclopropane-fatty-acyl-phospholipid synthase family protein [Candidatus Binatia bacterium]
MAISTSVSSDVDGAIGILKLLFRSEFARRFSVRLWDGTSIPAAERAEFEFFVNTPFALRAAFTPPLDLNPGRAYVERYIDIAGDAEAAVDAFATALERLPKAFLPLLAYRLARSPRPPSDSGTRQARLRGKLHTRARDAAAIGFHYDQPLAFYQTFLDPAMVYSCAYFDEGVASLEDAQRSKIDHIFRKIRLMPGDRLLDIGCGWGALVIAAAQRGARALGITLSRMQYEEAMRRISDLGLQGRAEVQLRDYRELGKRVFDKIVSVGMVEHVGRQRLHRYFEAALGALRPGGLFLNHGIADQTAKRRGIRASGFIDSYVFPDGDLIAVSDSNAVAERVGFEVRDVENLREHYARTLREWVANLEARHDEVVRLTDERTYRIWRLYMAGSAQGFNRGRMGLFQTLFAKADAEGRGGVSATRRDLYR